MQTTQHKHHECLKHLSLNEDYHIPDETQVNYARIWNGSLQPATSLKLSDVRAAKQR